MPFRSGTCWEFQWSNPLNLLMISFIITGWNRKRRYILFPGSLISRWNEFWKIIRSTMWADRLRKVLLWNWHWGRLTETCWRLNYAGKNVRRKRFNKPGVKRWKNTRKVIQIHSRLLAIHWKEWCSRLWVILCLLFPKSLVSNATWKLLLCCLCTWRKTSCPYPRRKFRWTRWEWIYGTSIGVYLLVRNLSCNFIRGYWWPWIVWNGWDTRSICMFMTRNVIPIPCNAW